jgi:radical SAM protein with 4Fe4S-binding SPASM domain
MIRNNSVFRNRLNLLSKLSFRRAWNAAIVVGGYFYSRVTRRASSSGLPVSLSIEPTTTCNLRCPQCPSGLRSFTRDTGTLQEDLFRKIVDESHSHLITMNFYFQGEPYLNAKLLDMVKYASAKKIYTITSTNAHFLTDENARRTVESGLDAIIISMDGTTQDVYERYRAGGTLATVIEGTKTLVKWKERLKSRTPYIVVQFLVLRSNEHQVEDVIRLAKECHLDEARLKTAQIYDYENGHEWIPTTGRYSRYRMNPSGKWSLKSRLPNHCWRMWHSCVMTWDGWVVPCCFDKDARHKLGNLRQRSLKEIWHDLPYRELKNTLLKSRRELDICANCTEGTKAGH